MDNRESTEIPQVVVLEFEPSLARMLAEVLPLEGFEVQRIQTAAKALSLLSGLDSKCTVFIDNLHLHREGQQLLRDLGNEPDMRARVKVVCMTVSALVESLRQQYGDTIDEYLLLPFTPPQLFGTLGEV